MVVALESLPSLNAEQLRELVQDLIAKMALQNQQHAGVIAAKDSDILYRQADHALYSAKAAGRNAVRGEQGAGPPAPQPEAPRSG